MMDRNPETKAALLQRLARVEGQIRGIQRLVQEDSECEKVAQQMTAARRALDKAFHEMLACMIQEEVMMQTADGGNTMEEVRRIFKKYA